ncbi:MAG TPA: thioredoxin fold domain-containing protein [Pseudomonadales bacterium]|nr:thioredoxin fold domain-containing protein [Pseudomonadales bacterium]
MVFAKLQRLIGGVLLGGMIMGAGARAEDPQAEVILKALSAARPDLQYEQPRPSPVAGLYEVQVKGGPLLYIDADGSHFIAGDLFAVQKSGFVNLAEQGRQKERAELIAAVKPEDMIIFAPENPKATIAVFTDVDCGYCRKLHSEVAELNALGIAVHYLAFPRAGLGSPSFRKIASAWCAKDPGAALTSLKNGEEIPENVCADNPVAAQMLLGEQVGVNGTPALVLEDGTLVPGYRPAKDLAKLLGIE